MIYITTNMTTLHEVKSTNGNDIISFIQRTIKKQSFYDSFDMKSLL